MTIQIRDVLKISNKDYPIRGLPFEAYLDLNETEREKIVPDNTAVHRGYIATWEVRDKKLYLINLDSQLTLKFPVFLKWFTGQIIVELGDEYITYDYPYGSYFKYNLFLYFDQGLLINSELRVNPPAIETIPFGKFKGCNLSEIIGGEVSKDPQKFAADYIRTLIGILNKDFPLSRYWLHKTKFSDETSKAIKIISNADIDFLVSKDFLAIKESNTYNSNTVSIGLELLFQGDYSNPQIIQKEGAEKGAIHKQMHHEFGDINYLKWIIRNAENYTIHPFNLLEQYKSVKIKELKTVRLHDSIFQFKVIVEELTVKIPRKLIEKGIKKYLCKVANNAYYDGGQVIVKDYTEINNYGLKFLIDKVYGVADNRRSSGIISDFEVTYRNYNGTYAQDHLGLSDQTINSAYEGDPDNAWNND